MSGGVAGVSDKGSSITKYLLETYYDKFPRIDAAPVEGHHPIIAAWRVYPELGRELTISDIGKKIRRTYPFLLQNDIHDWSFFIPYSDSVGARYRYLVLVSLENGGSHIKVRSGAEQPCILRNDGRWTTEAEFTAYLQAIPKNS